MKMKKSDEIYWAKRIREREAKWHDKTKTELEKEIKLYYQEALANIMHNIDILYARFAIDNELSIYEARKLIKGDEYRIWRMKIQEYVRAYEASQDDDLLKELNTLAMRSRITRLEKLHLETMIELHKLADKTDITLTKHLHKAYKDFYQRGLFDIGKRRGLPSNLTLRNTKEVEQVLKTPWSGKNYSERIWENKKELSKTLKTVITNAVHRGTNPDDMAFLLDEKMKSGLNNAKRLVYTELNYVQNQGILDSLKDAEFIYYKFVATLDERTTAICKNHDGEIYNLEDAKAGMNVPPLHPRCRSTIVGSLYKDKEKQTGRRTAKDKNNKRIFVPLKMSYKEWEEKYLEKNDKAFLKIEQICKEEKIKHIPVKLLKKELSTEKIIAKIAGGDKTKGSCSSLGFAYIGNRAGFDVTDFRGGTSCNVFAQRSNIEAIASLKGVISYTEEHTNDFLAVKKLFSRLEDGKEYYLATGEHAAIIRKNSECIEYLELQSPETKGYEPNGFHRLTNYKLKARFSCKTKHVIKYIGKINVKSLLIDIESIYTSSEFKNILGYINTKTNCQKKGD